MKYTLLFISFGLVFSGYSQTSKKKTTTKTTATKKSVVKTPAIAPVKSTTATPTVSSLTENEVATGLKEALIVSAKNAASQLNALDGFNKNALVRIPFPSEVSQVATKLRELGMGHKVDEFELTLNRAAEQASSEAAPIFVNAISQITIQDAKSILTGSSNSATSYLQTKTSEALTSSFTPIIHTALGNSLATSKWTEITTYYNKLPFITPVQTDLVKYTTGKALTGLFSVVAIEEKKIRESTAARTTDLLQKVFGTLGK